jgi:hypothetical protein
MKAVENADARMVKSLLEVCTPGFKKAFDKSCESQNPLLLQLTFFPLLKTLKAKADVSIQTVWEETVLDFAQRCTDDDIKVF